MLLVKKGTLKKIAFTVCTFALSLACSATGFAAFERGDDGQEVLAIQKRLVELHYNVGTLDGDYGQATENAIKKFQADKGLEVDGVVGPATYRTLMNAEMPVNRGVSLSRRVIRAGYGVIGVPYVFGGTTTRGFDCSGFTRYAFAQAGVYLPRMADEQYYHGRKIPVASMRPGDLIFFTTYEPGASHVGIYVGNGRFMHAGCSTGVTVSNLYDSYWGPRIYGACRVL